MVAHAYDPSTWEAETGGSLQIQDHPKLKASVNGIAKPCFKKTERKEKRKKRGKEKMTKINER